MKKNIFRFASIGLLILWSVIIFCFSAQDATMSSNVSGGIVQKLISMLFHKYTEMSSEAQQQIMSIITFLIRKFAHFFEYLILGVLSFLSLITFDKLKTLNIAIIAFAYCVLYAVSDEIHQYFVPGRACRFGDVCIDALGSALAIIILTIIIIKKTYKSGEINA